MLKNTLAIYKKDLKTIFTNYAVLITVIALCILPSLYAWINIKASWDPYSSTATSRIKVAAINMDKGTILNDESVNMGEKVIEELKKNNLLGWQFIDYEEAMRRLTVGEVYAAIIIPENFSSNITSLITDNVTKANIKYIYNEKLNAIAPKITVKGASGIQSSVSEQVVALVSDVILKTAKELGIEVEDVVLPKLLQVGTLLHHMISRFDEIDDLIDKTEGGAIRFSSFLDEMITKMPDVEKLIISTQDLIGNVDEFVGTVEVGVDTLAPTIKEDIGLVSEISEALYTYVEGLHELTFSSGDQIAETVSNLQVKLDALQRVVSALLKLLTKINNVAPTDRLTVKIDRLTTIQEKIQIIKGYVTTINEAIINGEVPDDELFNKIKILLQDIHDISMDLFEHFDSEVLTDIKNVFNSADTVIEGGKEAVEKVKETLPKVTDLMVSADDIMEKGDAGLKKVEEIVPIVKEKLIRLSDKIDAINSSKEIKDILALIKEDVSERVDFLSSAINMDEEIIFPMGNYGSQMAPFYSVLAAWVGLTILVSIISVEASGSYKSHEIYFGKLLTYLSITILQGLVIGLGDLYLLGIYCINPLLFVIGIVFVAVTFTFIVYSLVSVLGNVGKVVAIILMIIQVAGSGGTFPVQLTSNFFITINPYLPFTYGISFLREAIGGVESIILTKDVLVLAIFIVGSVILSVLLKKHINKVLEGFVHKFHEGGL